MFAQSEAAQRTFQPAIVVNPAGSRCSCPSSADSTPRLRCATKWFWIWLQRGAGKTRSVVRNAALIALTWTRAAAIPLNSLSARPIADAAIGFVSPRQSARSAGWRRKAVAAAIGPRPAA